jgi:multicomponent Na+:H+ antiporter subunit D
VLMIASALSSAAILRAGARVFLGWGPRDDWLLTTQKPEPPADDSGHIPAMVAITGVLIVLGLLVSIVPGLAQRAEYGAERMRDRAAYAERVLHNAPTKQTPARLPFVVQPTGTASVLYGLGAGALALLFAAFSLWRERLPRGWRVAGGRVTGPPIHVLKTVHSGVIGDYVMWLTVGTAVLGGIWALTLR